MFTPVFLRTKEFHRSMIVGPKIIKMNMSIKFQNDLFISEKKNYIIAKSKRITFIILIQIWVVSEST